MVEYSPDQATPTIDESPRLPPEIEHEIFVLALQSTDSIADKPPFLRVAKRVTEWLIPLFYNIITLYDGPDIPKPKCPSLTSLKIHGHHVHHFFLKRGGWLDLPYKLSELLSCCQNITNLGLWHGTDPPAEILKLSLQRLAIVHLGLLRDKLKVDPSSPEITKWSSTITHLALGSVADHEDINVFAQFPVLEYLMVFTFSNSDVVLDRILKRCPQLHGLIRLMGAATSVHETLVLPYPQSTDEDIRIVQLDALFVHDWDRGRKGLGDIWEIAEREIGKRRREHQSKFLQNSS